MGNKMKEKKKKDYGISLEVARAVSEKEKKMGSMCSIYVGSFRIFGPYVLYDGMLSKGLWNSL